MSLAFTIGWPLSAKLEARERLCAPVEARRLTAAEQAAERADARAEAHIIARASAGEPDSFRLLVERYRHQAYAIALRIVSSPEEAEEAAQNAFLRAWRALPRFRGECRFSTWLFRIVTRCALDRLASLRRRRGRETPLEVPLVEALAERGAAADDPGRARDRFRLERLIATLPDTARAVITLFYLQDRSVDEVAEVLQLPTGTVKTHLHRSRAALRQAWLRDTAQERDDELRRL
jgi:RNA polymerase sigma-70 factor (ECF subfamily)